LIQFQRRLYGVTTVNENTAFSKRKGKSENKNDEMSTTDDSFLMIVYDLMS